MKIVVNRCFGGYGLSARAVARMAEINGRPCFFFRSAFGAPSRQFEPMTLAEADSGRLSMFTAFDVPNPNELGLHQPDFHAMTLEEKQASSALYEQHQHDSRPSNRADATMIRVIEELGDAANGGCAQLEIVEIPDDVDWEISEYDGNEHVAEKHRVW